MGSAHSGAVLITGASTGIGAVCALQLAARGYRVFAGVRNTQDGETLAARASGNLQPILLDVTDNAMITEASSGISDALGGAGLIGLVNNAGIVMAGPLEFLPISALEQQLAVNVLGQVAVTQAFLPLLRQEQGRVIMMGSIAGRVATPFTGAYAASKHALEAITDALRVELQPWNIKVAIVEPGVIETPIWEKSEATAQALAENYPAECWELYGEQLAAYREVIVARSQQSTAPEKVADAVTHALSAARPKTRYLVGGDARLLASVRRWLPDKIRDWLIAKNLGLLSSGGDRSK
jgi:NAD(P)-dependent dehydrogenase (short-subunit alcohol dehydrogenase family)